MANGWRIAAIIFLVLFLVENIILCYWFYTISADTIKENECSLDICRDDFYYIYDTTRDFCYCYSEDWETVKQVYMGG